MRNWLMGSLAVLLLTPACRTVPPDQSDKREPAPAASLPSLLFNRDSKPDPTASIPEWIRRSFDIKAPPTKDGPGSAEPDIFAEATVDPGTPVDMTYHVKRGETLDLYSKWSGVPAETIRRKSGLEEGASLKVGATVILPLTAEQTDRYDAARLAFHAAYEQEFFARYTVSELRPYTITKGDSPWKVSRMGGEPVPLWLLEKVNPDIDLSLLQVGAQVRIPVLVANKGGVAAAKAIREAPAEERPKAVSGDFTPVQVRSGDTLGRYASRYGIDVADILKANPGLDPRGMQIGQKLRIPLTRGAIAAPAAAKPDEPEQDGGSVGATSGRYTTHSVRSGENAWSIAVKRYGVTTDALAAANPEVDILRLQPGMVLRVPRR